MMAIPWWGKILAKIVLSRIPLGYRIFAGIGVFRRGKMHDPAYAIGVFTRHFARWKSDASGSEFVGLELGVGDSVASAIVASAHGASTCYLVDTGRFAIEDVDVYTRVVAALKDRGFEVADIGGSATLNQVLSRYGGIYLEDGLRSLMTIPESSVDFVWSHAVLEHIREHEFDSTLLELYRIVRPGGILSHKVDLRDHLGGALNNKRIASRFWEAEWMARSGFYTNRISYRDMIRRFEAVGFSVENVSVATWKDLPTPRNKMASEFSAIPDEELLVSGFDVLLRR